MPIAPSLLPGNGTLQWAKNTIAFQWDTTGVSATSLIIDVYQGAAKLTTLVYPITSSNPFITVRLNKIIETMFSTAAPVYAYGVGTPQQYVGAVVNYSINYRANTSILSIGTPVNRTAILGGIDNMSFANEPDINQYTTFSAAKFFPNGSRFLTWMPTGRIMDANEVGWLTYYHVEATTPAKALYVVTYLDGSVILFNKAFPAIAGSAANTMWYIATGLSQISVDPTNKGVRYIDVYATDSSGSLYTSPGFRIEYDYRPFYAWLDVHYRNSVGGWDNFRFKGQVECSSDVTRKEYERSSNDALGNNPYYNTGLRFKWKANTGYISRQQMIALNDLLRSTDVRILIEGQWLNVRCTSTSFKWEDSANGLHNELVELETAGSFQNVPKQMMLLYARFPELR
jgi:hypothetical protein